MLVVCVTEKKFSFTHFNLIRTWETKDIIYCRRDKNDSVPASLSYETLLTAGYMNATGVIFKLE